MKADQKIGHLVEGGRVFQLETDWHQQAMALAQGLAYAVGKLDGLGEGAGFAGEVLDRWRYPARIIPPDEADRSE